MKKGIFETLGYEGKLGLKADDLNKCAKLITDIGFFIPEGMVITTEVFEKVIAELGILDLNSGEEKKYVCPDFLLTINEELLGKMEIGKPYAIRSSALSENGGIGIYQSRFFWVTGDEEKDLQELWQRELIIYASEFSRDAELWRKKKSSADGHGYFDSTDCRYKS